MQCEYPTGSVGGRAAVGSLLAGLAAWEGGERERITYLHFCWEVTFLLPKCMYTYDYIVVAADVRGSGKE